MRVLCVFGQHNYGDASRGEGYEFTNFMPALSRLGHDVTFFESHNRSLYADYIELNRALLKTVEIYRPDIILSVSMLYEVWLETWEILRDAGIGATISWAADDSWKYRQSSKLTSNLFHAITTTYEDAFIKYHKDGSYRIMLTQWAANAAVTQVPLPSSRCIYPITFVGTAHGDRLEKIKALADWGIDVLCFGHGWPNGPVSAIEIPRIIQQSIISLNFANAARVWENYRVKHINQIKARTFEVPGAGGFLLTEWAPGLDRFYQIGKEIDVFHSLEELANKIRHYVTNTSERDEIARAGYIRTLKEHTYDIRFKEIIGFALKQKENYFSAKGQNPTNQVDWKRFELTVNQHRLTRKERLLKKCLLALCSKIWGPIRGPRAARRLVFEISWRICGSTTYSAKGLPGRMFYDEG